MTCVFDLVQIVSADLDKLRLFGVTDAFWESDPIPLSMELFLKSKP